MQQCCADCHTTHPSFPALQVDGSQRTPFMLVGRCPASVMCAARGELSGSSAATQALLCGQLDAAVWLLRQPGGATLEALTNLGAF